MANAGAIDTVLWPGCKAEVGEDLANGGSYANKSGYHNSRNNLRSSSNPDWRNDYSIQLPIDHLGPGDLGSAIDLTFRSAQGGDFSHINKYSRRLLEAGQSKDPRVYPLREFQGNIDSDRDVEGWSFYRDHALTSSDKSHLWHIHLSIHRKYINDADAMRSILEIWNGEDMALSSDDIEKIAEKVLSLDGQIPNKTTAGSVIFSPDAGAYISLKNAVYEQGKDLATIKASLSLIKAHLKIS